MFAMEKKLNHSTLKILETAISPGGLRDLLIGVDESAVWPPDLFAYAALILSKSGDYARVADSTLCLYDGQRAKKFTHLGEAYRSLWSVTGNHAPEMFRHIFSLQCFGKDALLGTCFIPPPLPSEVRNVVADLCSGAATDVGCHLVDLMIFADAFSAGFGLPYEPSSDSPEMLDVAWTYAMALLLRGAAAAPAPQGSPSLASDALKTLYILPKQHTPQVGITIRSLSHHLAVVETNEVRVRWWIGSKSAPSEKSQRSINVLLAPWPVKVERTDFAHSPDTAGDHFGLFDFKPQATTSSLMEWFRNILDSAELRVQRLDMVLFPELALSAREFQLVAEMLEEKHPHCALLAGINADYDGRPCNKLQLVTSLFREEQRKHHRWRLDESQIENYGLARQLNPELPWWENMRIGERELSFFVLSADLVVTGLICEDLARQEPVASIVRSVGPNLVLVPLMDGPQLPHRWSARYSSVLADDPGCSVLTLTSLGMVELSCSPDAGKPSRSIALWRHPGSAARAIELPEGRECALLTIAIENTEEWTADGRSDGGISTVPQLKKVSFPPIEPLRSTQPQSRKKEKLILDNEREGALVAFLATLPVRDYRKEYRNALDRMNLSDVAKRLVDQLLEPNSDDEAAHEDAQQLHAWGQGMNKIRRPRR